MKNQTKVITYRTTVGGSVSSIVLDLCKRHREMSGEDRRRAIHLAGYSGRDICDVSRGLHFGSCDVCATGASS